MTSDTSPTIELTVPDEAFPRYDLLLECRGAVRPTLTVDGLAEEPSRFQQTGKWTLSAYDFRGKRGKTLNLSGSVVPLDPESSTLPGKSWITAWVVADRAVDAPPVTEDHLPFAIGQHQRRVTRNLIPKTLVRQGGD